jgi:DNA-binding NtrC family response regulator
MSATNVSSFEVGPAAARTVIVASTDAGLRTRLRASLSSLRWQVREAGGGAEAIAQLEEMKAEALLLDSWLPDLDVTEFVGQVRLMHPFLDLVRIDSGVENSPRENQGARSPRRNELLHALREAQNAAPQNDTAVWATATVSVPRGGAPRGLVPRLVGDRQRAHSGPQSGLHSGPGLGDGPVCVPIPELVGGSSGMAELRALIRLVAPRSTSVLIEGETGTGKEVVAKALHRLSQRSAKAFVVLNCAAIPESLLEAELFGHTRGAFTGAVQSRTGRIEAAHGGTLFLDEIGEMPLALQAKMLRFLECGELQRVGDNETLRVDVRVIAATHQPLERRAQEKTFRLDLYHRLAVFPIEVPALRDRRGDLELLVDFFLDAMGQDAPQKRISVEAMAKLRGYDWPGNVRELMHVLERGAILSEERREIEAGDVRFGRVTAG